MGGAYSHTVAPTECVIFAFEMWKIYIFNENRFLDCVGLTSTYEIAMLQDESLKLLSESSGSATRMGHILLTLPYIRAAADRKVIQVFFFLFSVLYRNCRRYQIFSNKFFF